MENLFIYLEMIEDEREEWKVKHKLKDIIVIVLFSTLANADDWQEITMFVHHNKELLLKYIELENGIPSHDTIQRVFSCINPEVLKKLQLLWNELLNKEEGEKLKKILCLDGKTIKGSSNKNQEALHVVSAWSKEKGNQPNLNNNVMLYFEPEKLVALKNKHKENQKFGYKKTIGICKTT